jgi:uncharacterized protein (DUF2461 family)
MEINIRIKAAQHPAQRKRSMDLVRDALDRIDCGEAHRTDMEFLVNVYNRAKANKGQVARRLAEMIEPYLLKHGAAEAGHDVDY